MPEAVDIVDTIATIDRVIPRSTIDDINTGTGRSDGGCRLVGVRYRGRRSCRRSVWCFVRAFGAVGVQISDISAVELWISRARIVDRATVRVGELPCVLSCFALGQFGTNVHSRNGNRQHDTIDVDRLVLGQRPV